MTTKEAVALLERYSNYDGMGIQNLAGCKEAMRVAVEVLKEACPELKESEDERIRKAIVKSIEEDLSVYEQEVSKEQMLAWLEKQKECLADNSKTSESEDEIREELIGALMWQRDCLDAKGPHDNNLILPGFTMKVGDILEWLEKQKEKKQSLSEKFRPDFPAVADFIESVDNMERNRAIGILEDYLKWAVSSEEECRYTWKELADAIQLGIDAMKEQKPAEYLDKDRIYAIMKKLHNLSFSQDILINSKEYKQIDEITHDVRDLLDYPIEQKQEWSEKEKKMLAVISYKISQHQGNDERSLFTPDEAEFIDGIEDKFKSLRPSWKPSEEQMTNLLRAEGRLRIEGESVLASKLADLYEQLKKLM